MVSDNPESFADLDGHDQQSQNSASSAGDCTTKGSGSGAACPAQSTTQDTGTAQNQNAPLAAGAVAGTLSAAEETGAEIGSAVGPEGALVGAAIGAAVYLSLDGDARPPAYVPGGSLTDQNGNSMFTSSKSDTPATSGPKAADAPGVTSGGQATNEHGQKLGPSGKPQVNNVDKNTREKANNAANKGSGTVEHGNPSRGDPHFHTQRGDGTKKQDSTHYNYPE
jgi:hypothetical protein